MLLIYNYCRDLKPENILLGDDMHIQITDFGTAKIFETEGEGIVHVVMSFHYLSRNFILGFHVCLDLVQSFTKNKML